MALTVVRAELQKTLQAFADEMNLGTYQIGLYRTDVAPDEDTAIGDITPANFSGYGGLQLLEDWAAVIWTTPRAIINHSPIEWEHNGGGVSNDIYGYYVVDGVGALAWLEPKAGGAVNISVNGQTYTVIPQYTRRSEF